MVDKGFLCIAAAVRRECALWIPHSVNEVVRASDAQSFKQSMRSPLVKTQIIRGSWSKHVQWLVKGVIAVVTDCRVNSGGT